MNLFNKTLHFITSRYPFGNGETFVENELKSLCEAYNEVIIYPMKYNDKLEKSTIRKIPANAKVVTINQSYNFRKLVKVHFKTFINLVALDLSLDSLHRLKKLKNLRYQLGYFIAAINIKNQLTNHIDPDKSSIFYSYWMHEGALALTLLKKEQKIKKFFFKCHGFDVYNEVHERRFIPFRSVNYKFTDQIITISKANREYIKALYPAAKDKLKVIYMGSSDYGLPKQTNHNKEYLIFSCSNMIPLKRVEYIPKILEQIKDINIHWVHAGDGITEKKTKKACENLSNNIRYSFLGRISHEEIFEFYKNNKVDLLLHLSESEGLPVSMMEAISFGVPIMACDVGGVSEVVTKDTGVLLDKNFNIEDVAFKIKSMLVDNNPQFDYKIIRDFWEENFDHKKNVQELIDVLNK